MTEPRTMQDALEPTSDPAWLLTADGFDPLRENVLESRFTVSNGFLGVRATRVMSRGERWVLPPRTYVAGLFDIPSPEQPIPELVAAADWLKVGVNVLGRPLVPHPADLLSYRAILDMRRGVLLTGGRVREPGGPVRVRTLRLVSLSDRALGLQVVELEIEQGEVEITLEASFGEGAPGLRAERLDEDLGVWRTPYSGRRLAIAGAASLLIDGHELAPIRTGQSQLWTWKTRPGQIVSLQRLVAVVRSEREGPDPGEMARTKLHEARKAGWRTVVADHEAAWSRRWQCSDIEVEGDPDAQLAFRFAAYHLNSAANPDDDRVSIGARGLTGEDYHGHVFWDTEIYLLPFYTLTWPEAARAMLLYRFHTLNGARAKAARMGWRGAMYAWESADTGEETTPEQVIGPDGRIVPVLCGKLEQHVTADVAYAVWQYWQATRDEGFLTEGGAEIMLETGRFWASRAQPEPDGRCHIRGVIGPDEYHENIDDNAFTNVMARWNIRRALDIAALLRERWPERWAVLSSRLDLNDTELSQWRSVAETIATGFDPKTGLFEQFAGFFSRDPIDLASYAGRTVPMDVVLGHERIQRTQVVKQADVVALMALLPEEFPGETAALNFHYYEPRCSHGSSLSAGIHGLVAARLGCSEMAMRYFRQAVAIDLSDTHVTIAGGLHVAALGGAWQTAVLGFAGLSLQADSLSLDPKLPDAWQKLCFSVQWRGRHVRIRIDQAQQHMEATLEAGEPMPLAVSGNRYELRMGEMVVCRTT
ncbi:MAG: glycoside hydrolase family 65 protein, partial [Acetobacteraceae bacterium]|nr:glycoside hydrolase family 65 protein [Acetobacteraceae bacterium]